jgi:hypothetical protein
MCFARRVAFRGASRKKTARLALKNIFLNNRPARRANRAAACTRPAGASLPHDTLPQPCRGAARAAFVFNALRIG